MGGERRPAGAGQLAVFGPGDAITFEAASKQDSRSDALEAVILRGQPIGEPVAWYGPFVMNTEREIRDAFDDFHAGRLGTVPAHPLARTEQVAAQTDAALD